MRKVRSGGERRQPQERKDRRQQRLERGQGQVPQVQVEVREHPALRLRRDSDARRRVVLVLQPVSCGFKSTRHRQESCGAALPKKVSGTMRIVVLPAAYTIHRVPDIFFWGKAL